MITDIPRPADIVNRITCIPVELDPCREVRKLHRGWSNEWHYVFFKHLLSTGIETMLVCGVYRGLDLALLSTAAKALNRTVRLTGVDLFENAPLPDWPEDKQRNCATWEAAGFGPPPSIEAARIAAPEAEIYKSDSVSFMQKMADQGRKFDAIYLDTSHDEAQVRREILAARQILAPRGVLCGDDYTDGVNGSTGWGVHTAVQALCPHHVVMFVRIWMET